MDLYTPIVIDVIRRLNEEGAPADNLSRFYLNNPDLADVFFACRCLNVYRDEPFWRGQIRKLYGNGPEIWIIPAFYVFNMYQNKPGAPSPISSFPVLSFISFDKAEDAAFKMS